MIDPFAVARRIVSRERARKKKLDPVVNLNASSSSRYIHKEGFATGTIDGSRRSRSLDATKDWKSANLVESSHGYGGWISVGNKGAESVKSRHVVIRYGLLALRLADLLRVQSSEYKISSSSSLGYIFSSALPAYKIAMLSRRVRAERVGRVLKGNLTLLI